MAAGSVDVDVEDRALNRFKELKRKPETNEILTGT